MSIKQKLMVTIILLVSIPMLVSVVVGTWAAKDIAGELLVEQAEKNLIAMREFRKHSFEEYTSVSRKQIITLANSDTVINAANRFGDSYRDLRLEGVSDLDARREGLSAFYHEQFGVKYHRRNPGSSVDPDQLMTGLNDNAIAMQSLYISENPNPLGEKEKLDSSGDNSTYSIWHQSYHDQFRHFLQAYEYYDIFIVHPTTGDIMYSVFKELDYGTSLVDGPYADSGIGEAFRAANEATDKSFTYLTDLAAYTPSYEDPALFISTPIFSNARKIGVLIFQLPVDKIKSIMTDGESWERDGLGKTGEVYLVGPDKMLRSEMRAMIETPDIFVQELRQQGIDDKITNTVAARGSSVMLHRLNSSGIDKALSEESGSGVYVDAEQNRVLSAYAKLEIPGLDWVIISEMDEEEAFAPAYYLSETLLKISITVAGTLLIVAILLGFWFTTRLTNPIKHLEKEIVEIENDSDLARRVSCQPSDVTSGISETLNNMLEKLHGIVNMVADSSVSMATAASDMQVVSKLTSSDTRKQKEKTDQINSAMEKMSATVVNVAANADEAHKAVKTADGQAVQGNTVVLSAVESITKLADEIQRASDVIAVLSQEATNIGGVLDVIRNIAEQTNLLALNAAIEAARAGEQGRGFAVVADEVRTLASRTQESTEEIQQMIEGLQSGANNAVTVMEQGQKQAEISVNKANEASSALKKITGSVTEITTLNENIAAASIDQRAVADEVTRDIGRISEISDSTSCNAEKTEQASSELNELAIKLQSAVANFKL